MARWFRIPRSVTLPLPSVVIVGVVMFATVFSRRIPLGRAAKAQIGSVQFWVGLSPEAEVRLSRGTIGLDDLARGGLVVASDGRQPGEVVLIAAHLRDGKVVDSGLSRPLRLTSTSARAGSRYIGETEKNLALPGTDQPARQAYPIPIWSFDFAIPEGAVPGGPRVSGLAKVGLPGDNARPVFVSVSGFGAFDRGGETADLGVYAGGIWIERNLEKADAEGQVNWDRYEALFLLPIPLDPGLRSEAQARALIVPFVPRR